MKITEYTIINIKHPNGPFESNYDILKLGENLYYKEYTPEDGIVFSEKSDYLPHFVPERTEEFILFLKKHFDDYGKWVNLESCKTCGKQISRPTPEDSDECHLCNSGVTWHLNK